MESLSISTTAKYLSIQEGFEWKDIPRFAVITGVNGIGKTQLLQLFNGGGKHFSKLTSSNGEIANAVFSDSVKKDLTIEGLIKYKKESLTRKAKINGFKKSITNIEYHNKNLEVAIRNATDLVEKETLIQQIKNNKTNIDYFNNEIKNLIIPSYDNEILQLCSSLGKNYDELTTDDILKCANPFFNTLTEIDDLSLYIKQEEDIRNQMFITLSKEGRENEISRIRSEERSFEIINRLFKKFGFKNFEMLDPFPIDKSRNGEIVFQGKTGERISYGSLSSGEQMIVKFIMWVMGKDIRGRRINTMVYDEPDAHLHPSMCKMMVEIFEELSKTKEDGGSDIRIIITTHSPSTVAFAPEWSLFVMEKDSENNRHIRSIGSEEAIRILSEGIFTYDKAMKSFHQAINSNKSGLLFVEGKSDVIHLSKAMSMLGYDLDLDIFDLHDAGSLASFIKSTPAKLFSGKKVIALFDNDSEGRKSYGSIVGDVSLSPGIKILSAEQCKKQSYALLIKAPEQLDVYCPIEFLYPMHYLREKNMIIKRSYSDYQNLFKPKDCAEAQRFLEEYNSDNNLRSFAVGNNKVSFASNVEQETDKDLFKGFIPTLELINKIMQSS